MRKPNERFPNYKSPEQVVKEFEQAKDRERREQEAALKSNPKRAAHVLRTALPLLREHARGLAKPIASEVGLLIAREVLTPGWIVYHQPAEYNGSCDTPYWLATDDVHERFVALTEDGRVGNCNPIHGASIEAYHLSRVSVDVTSTRRRDIARGVDLPHGNLQETVGALLGAVGIAFDIDFEREGL